MTRPRSCRLPVPGSQFLRQPATGNRQRFLAFLLTFLAATSVFAQVTNLGPAGQYYKSGPPKKGRFSFIRPPQKGGEIELLHAKSQSIEKDEYAVFEGDVKFKYEDITLSGDKFTYNFKTKDVTGEGHVILDQGSTRLAGSQMVFNLNTKTGTFFNATGSMEPAMYFTGE